MVRGLPTNGAQTPGDGSGILNPPGSASSTGKCRIPPHQRHETRIKNVTFVLPQLPLIHPPPADLQRARTTLVDFENEVFHVMALGDSVSRCHASRSPADAARGRESREGGSWYAKPVGGRGGERRGGGG